MFLSVIVIPVFIIILISVLVLVIFIIIVFVIGTADIIQLIFRDDYSICISYGNNMDKISVGIYQRMLQILDQLSDLSIPALCILLSTFQNDLFQTVRNVGNQLGGRRDLLLQMFHSHLYRGFTVKGHFSCHHLIQSDTNRVNIALLIAVSSPGLFRRCIVYRSHGHRTYRRGCNHPRNAEICHFYFSIIGNNNVLRLDIPVYNMMLMRFFNAHTHLDPDADHFFRGKPALFVNVILQRNAFHKLHDNIVKTSVLPYIINIYNIGIEKSCRCLCLGPEFPDKCFIFPKFFFQYFDRDIAIQHMVLALIHIRHAAGSNFL